MLAYYPFQPNAFLADASGVTGSLVNTGSVASVPSSMTGLQNAAYFTQASGQQYFTLPQITIGQAFSVCAWYKPDLNNGEHPRIMELSSGVLTGNIQIRRDATQNNLAIEIWNGGTFLQAGGIAIYTGLFQLGAWQHVCLTVSGTTGKVYYNGALQAATISLTAQKTTTTYTKTYLGNTPWNNDLYSGLLDEVRIYSRAVSASEVTSIFNFRGSYCAAGTFHGPAAQHGEHECHIERERERERES
jgi:hypothetical protein